MGGDAQGSWVAEIERDTNERVEMSCPRNQISKRILSDLCNELHEHVKGGWLRIFCERGFKFVFKYIYSLEEREREREEGAEAKGKRERERERGKQAPCKKKKKQSMKRDRKKICRNIK